jgi:hypothetical protein
MRETELPEGLASTDPSLPDVLTELQRREPIFHRRELGTTRADFEAITSTDFWEVGASGEVYSREQVWASLERRYADPDYWAGDSWETSDFLCRQLTPNAYLLTYRLRQRERVTRRLTIWKRSGDAWEIVYHQGTVVSAK